MAVAFCNFVEWYIWRQLFQGCSKLYVFLESIFNEVKQKNKILTEQEK